MQNVGFRSLAANSLVLMLTLFLMIGCRFMKKKEARNKKPNILFILVDDLGYSDLGYTGSTYHETPNIDQLALEGMIFTNAYAASPVCSPSRAAIMTGKYPARLNLTDYIPGNRHYGPHKDQKLASLPFNLYLDPKETTVGEAFKAAGYSTFFAGKWHLGNADAYFPNRQGFDVNKGGNGTGHPAGGYFAPYKNAQLDDGPKGEYLTDRLTDEVIQFIKQKRKSPFFAFLSFYTVHLPMQGKPVKVEKYQNKLAGMDYYGDEFTKERKTYFKNRQNMPHYAAMVESMDENIGHLLQALKESGSADNTIIIVTSDNGGMATSDRTDNIPTTNAPLRAGKGFLYEGGIREPLIVCWPNRIKAGSTCDVPVIGTDFYPTLLDLAGLPLQSDQPIDGSSFKPLLENKKLQERPIFWHYPHYSGGLGGRPSGAVRLGDFKLIEFYEDMHVELYNLKTDEEERKDLSEVNPVKREALKKLLHQWRIETKALMPYPNPQYVE